MERTTFSAKAKSHRRIATALIVAAVVTVTGIAQSSAAGPPIKLVAIGDSFTAGSGVGPYNVDNCPRSQHAYVEFAGALLGASTANYACGGAETTAITGPFRGGPAQDSHLDGATDVVMTIGGNDIGLTESIVAVGIAGNTKSVTAKLPALETSLVSTYSAVKKSAPNASIYAVSYPDLFPNSNRAMASCMGITGYAIDLPSLHAMSAALNATIKRAANTAGIHYVNADAAFKGHEMCTTDPWVFAPAGAAPAHPNKAGQQVLGQVLAKAIKATPVKVVPTTEKPKPTTTVAPKPTTTTTTVKANDADVALQYLLRDVKTYQDDPSALLGALVARTKQAPADVSSVTVIVDGKALLVVSRPNNVETPVTKTPVLTGTHAVQVTIGHTNGSISKSKIQNVSL